MNADEVKKIKMAYAGLADLYQRPQYSDPALKIIGSILGDLDFHSVMNAIEKWCKTTKYNRPPTPGELREIIFPTETAKDESRYLAGQIMGCIARYGYTWALGAYIGGTMKFSGKGGLFDSFTEALKSEVGDAGVHCVNVFGGWKNLCEREGNEGIGTLQAQVRDFCESMLIKAKQGTLNENISLQGADKNQLQAAPENIIALLPKKGME